MNRGHLSAIIAYLLWGLSRSTGNAQARRAGGTYLSSHPVVIRSVDDRDGPLETTTHLRIAAGDRATIQAGMEFVVAILIAINWLVFIIAVQQNQVLESSLGYFITPLMSVALGSLLLARATGTLAMVGGCDRGLGSYLHRHSLGISSYLCPDSGHFLWNLWHRQETSSPLGRCRLWLETAILVIPAGAYLAYEVANGRGSFGTVDRLTDALIIAAGPITTIPLLLFAFGARRIPLFQLGILQYIAPSIQFVVGWLALREPVSFDRWVGFSLVWLALIVFTYAQTQSPGRTRTQ